ncbi:MAG: hypothetical protein GKR87_02145 [Kiritimatiellae bacterium]|nr:hypothetical protein [Kiritimatiellia bacterium]
MIKTINPFFLSSVLCLCINLSIGKVSANEEELNFEVTDAGEMEYSDRDVLRRDASDQARIERSISLPLPRTLRKGSMQYSIEHRNRTSVDEEPFHNFFGFDAGDVKIGFGLSYGVLNNLDVGVRRLNGTVERFDTYQFSSRLQLLSETTHALDLALLGGSSLYTIRDDTDAWSGFRSLLVGRSFFKRFYFSSGVLYHDNSTAREKTAGDEKDSTAIMGAAILRLTDRLLFSAEWSAPVAGYEASSTAWAGALKFVTHGHTFSLVGANTQYMTLDGLAAGTSFDDDEVVIGFSITREFLL